MWTGLSGIILYVLVLLSSQNICFIGELRERERTFVGNKRGPPNFRREEGPDFDDSRLHLLEIRLFPYFCMWLLQVTASGWCSGGYTYM